MKKQDNLISLEKLDGQIKVVTPYNKEFVNRCRNLRGQWKNGAWWFDDTLIDYVREAMIAYFYTTGEDNCGEVDLIIKDYSGRALRKPVVLFGRVVAKAFGKDSIAKLGDDIVFLSGDYYSAGSYKNWETVVSNATFIMRRMPTSALNFPEVADAIKEGWCEIKENNCREIADIESDIKQLQERLAELQKELENARSVNAEKAD